MSPDSLLFVDGDGDCTCTLDAFLHANQDLDREDIESIVALDVGESVSLGGGAWASYTVTRAS